MGRFFFFDLRSVWAQLDVIKFWWWSWSDPGILFYHFISLYLITWEGDFFTDTFLCFGKYLFLNVLRHVFLNCNKWVRINNRFFGVYDYPQRSPTLLWNTWLFHHAHVPATIKGEVYCKIIVLYLSIIAFSYAGYL